MIEIRKVGDKTISIVDSESGKKYYGSAIYHATSITGQTVTIRSNDSTQPTFVGEVSNISIDGAVKNSVVDCLVALNTFIGSFRSATAGGGAGGVSPITPRQLLWNREVVSFGAGDSELSIALKERTETILSTPLIAGNSVVISCPPNIEGKIVESVFVFEVGSSVGTVELPTNVVWRGERPLVLLPNKSYTLVFEVFENDVKAIYI